MELCPGGSLADRLADGRRMAPDDLVPVLVQIADGLADLHRRGVVHRDIKPQNILFAANRAKLADFGVAQSDDAAGTSELTMPGTAVGTLAYLAPEILAGERATTAADVHGLGVVAFVALTGRPPRPAVSMADLVAASRSPAARVSTVAADLGPAFDDTIAAALAVRPADRPDVLAFASGLTTALGRWTRDGGPARRSSTPGGAPAGQRLADEPVPVGEATTAVAMPLMATAAIPVDRSPVGRASGGSDGRGSGSTGSIAIWGAMGAVVLAVIAFLIGRGAIAPAALPSPIPGASASAAARVAPSVSPSIQVTPVPATPSPTADPAIAALDAMGAAISAARGGPGGLKGKEANDLDKRLGSVRQALDGGDRAAALDAAQALERRVRDVVKEERDDWATRLRTASADLVRSLGG